MSCYIDPFTNLPIMVMPPPVASYTPSTILGGSNPASTTQTP